ncbi:hypothetical protein BT69DRAFT_1308275 [Atractiella rhizophila]|nr:hypothetical protein BT69DRAFT_1308275 [Atractiella rhizophila]
MIKNVPNRMTDIDLMSFVDEVVPRKYDFLYLRVDFRSKANVGYGFINFIDIDSLLRFCRAKLGVKWGVFSSDKICLASYASIQGKEALIAKFRNSQVMDERVEFRPKVFHSSGPMVGLPEPFPAPDNMRRKARSKENAANLVRCASTI